MPTLHRPSIPTPPNLDLLDQAIYFWQEMENGWSFVACRVFAPNGTMIYHRKKGGGAEGGRTRIWERAQQVVWLWCTRPLYFKRGVVAFSASSPSRHPRFNLRVGLQQLHPRTPRPQSDNPQLGTRIQKPGIEGRTERLENRGVERNSNHDPTRLLPH